MPPEPPGAALARLTARAAQYDLRTRAARQRSAADLRKMFFGLLPVIAPAVVIEAGAHDARGARRARRLLPQARVVAYEANPHNHAHFAAATDFAAQGVDYRLAALTDAPGPVTFRVLTADSMAAHGPRSGRSSLLARTDAQACTEPVTVPGDVLDTHAPGTASAALWVDVEGAAGPVLQGGPALLAVTDLLMIEVESRPVWDGQWLAPDICAHLMARGLVPLARDFERRTQFNLLFASERALARPEVLPVLEAHVSRSAHVRD